MWYYSFERKLSLHSDQFVSEQHHVQLFQQAEEEEQFHDN
jgi:hypothetical protein